MSTTPEYLDSHGGRPEPTRGRRTAWVVGGAGAVLAVLGVGAWAAWSFFATGAQPAEALPASTIAYASIDLDPSGGQKIEALRTLREFPAIKDELDLDTDDDVRRRIFEAIQDSGTCPDLDFADDVEPWLGDRMAVAAVDTGEDEPAPVLVLQVSDEDAADAGLSALEDCAGEDADTAWSIRDGWAVVGESQDVLDQMADDAAQAPLSDDDDFRHWTGEAGGGGIATVYVAAAAGELVADRIGTQDDAGAAHSYEECPAPCLGYAGVGTDDVPPEVGDALRDFGGMAATLRFDDGALELEVAADAGDAQSALAGSTGGDDVVATLPEDTGVALGVGFAQGWLADLVDDDTLRRLSDETGLDWPEDAETLVGSSTALAVSGDIDPEAAIESADGSDVPVGLKVLGDADAIADVVERLGGPFEVDSDGEVVAVGPDADYRAELLEDGGLGDTDVYRRALPDAADASAVLFVGFDAGDWLDRAVGDDAELADNLAPLEAVGLSATTTGDTTHVVLRVTTG